MAGRVKRISIIYSDVIGVQLSSAVNFLDPNIKGYFVLFIAPGDTRYTCRGVYRSIRQCMKKGGLNNHRSLTGQTGQIVFYSAPPGHTVWQNANTGNPQM